MFQNSEAFLDLLLKQSARTNYVLARIYCNGAWHQISGQDFCAHLGRAAQYWLDALPQSPRGDSVMVIGKNTYTSFVVTLGAILCGFDVMCMPAQMSKADITWCLNHFTGTAIATDMTEIAENLKNLSVPVFNISQIAWMPLDTHSEPPLLTQYREQKNSAPKQDKETETQHQRSPGVKFGRVGRFCFVSFGHDGFQRPEILNADALVTTAQNFLTQVKIPKQIFWKSMELMPPSNPFAHLSRFCVLIKNGIMGFPNPTTDWETNLRILRPSFIFASSQETNQLCSFVDEIKRRKDHNQSLKLSLKIDDINNFLSTNRAMKLPEFAFDFVKRSLRFTSRMLAGKAFVQQSVEDLRFVIHGLAPAQENCVKLLEKLGIPVIESYGTTGSAGMLSCNEFTSPHFNTIGSPLPQVEFRLGDQSTLEFKLSNPVFSNTKKWEETGDVAQMTPFGLIITGRKRHLFVTLGGVIVSPVRLEKLLKENDTISDACVIGHKMPYLSALIVLNAHAQADYREDPQKVKERVALIISQVNETLPRNVTIKKFKILEKNFSEADGEKLSHGQINRLKIQQTREQVIASLYQ